MKPFIQLIFIVVFFYSCQNNLDDNQSKQNKLKPSNTEANRINFKTIDSIKYKDYALSKEAYNATLAWTKYKELSEHLSNLKQGQLRFFEVEDAEELTKLMVDVKATIPNRIKTFAIQSRLMVVETYAIKLNDNLTLNNITLDVQLKNIKQLLIAFSNLNLQINKKLEFERYNNIAIPN